MQFGMFIIKLGLCGFCKLLSKCITDYYNNVLYNNVLQMH